MKITKEWLKEKRACCSEQDMDRAEKELKGDVSLITDTLLKEDRFNDANWLLTKLMDKNQCVGYAIFAAKQVLGIFEEKCPKDDRPRKAIEAAENYLKNPSEENRKAAYASATYASASAASASAASASASASVSAASAASAASASAASAAYAAAAYAAAAYDAYAASASASDVKTKIIKYGIKILDTH